MDMYTLLAPQIIGRNQFLYWYLSPRFGSSGIIRSLNSDGIWSSAQKVDDRRFSPLLFVQTSKKAEFVGLATEEYNHIYATSLTSNQNQVFSATQTITLPQTIHQPTLSFMYNLEGDTSDRSFFEVSVSTGITETSIFSTTERAAWRQGWADMSAWKGQTITLTLSAHQAISDTYIQVDVDEITLGAWTTPQPKQAIPAKIDSGIQTTLLISGENFLATPTVSIGNYTVTDVQWLNEKEIQATLPANIPPGIYNITVVNPDGTRNSAQSILAIGKQVYLPIISR